MSRSAGLPAEAPSGLVGDRRGSGGTAALGDFGVDFCAAFKHDFLSQFDVFGQKEADFLALFGSDALATIGGIEISRLWMATLISLCWAAWVFRRV